MPRAALSRLSRLSLLSLLSLLTVGCEQTGGGPHTPSTGAPSTGAPLTLDEAARAYLADDLAIGRAALIASLVDPTNGYSQRRIQRYTADAWGALPVGWPRVRPVTPDGAAPAARVDFAARLDALDDPDMAPDGPTVDALIALGAQAFRHWPLQVTPSARRALDDPAAVGLWQTADRVGGLVEVELPAGPELAITCSTCHATPGPDGQLIAGRTHAPFDLGAMMALAHGGPPRGRWGPGAVDVTPDDLHNPTVITDLRPIRFQTHLHRAGTVRNTPLALAVRIETLIITSIGEAWRPPRAVALGLALYLWSLGEALPPPDDAAPGAAIFAARCAGCHPGAALGGGLVPLAAVDPDSPVGRSPARGTGFWRVPSLRGVGDRSPLLADASVPDLAALLDPTRVGPAHRFGLDLDPGERAALLEWLWGR